MRSGLIMLPLVALLWVSACSEEQPPAQNAPVEVTTPTLREDDHSSRNALDWQGSYQGILPCADCEGIETVIRLNADGSYERRTRYLGTSTEVQTEEGMFQWSEDGGSITLGSGEDTIGFRVGEHHLLMLDKSGDPIEGDLQEQYTLVQKTNPPLKETYWKLVELMGKPVESGQQDIFIILKEKDNTVTGSDGCNRLMGQYQQEAPERLQFGKMASTMMACVQGMETGSQFVEMLERVDSFGIHDGQLQLYRARMAPLARFEAVYLR